MKVRKGDTKMAEGERQILLLRQTYKHSCRRAEDNDNHADTTNSTWMVRMALASCNEKGLNRMVRKMAYVKINGQ